MAIIKLSISERRRLSAFLTCLVLASLAWAFVKLSGTYSYTVRQVLVYKNAPHKRAFMPLQSDTVEVTMQGNGWQMLFSRMNKPQPFTIDLQSLDHTDFVALNKQLNQINAKMNREHKIIDFNPDTLYFDFTSRLVKKIKVQALLNLQLEPKYAVSGPVIVQPEYVTLNGPAKVISTIDSWKTDSLKLRNVNKPVDIRLLLLPVKTGDINVYPKIVQVHIPVEEYTEKTLDLPVELVNNPNYYTVKVFPQKVRVTFTTPLSSYAGMDEHDFTLQADLRLWQQEGYTELPIKIVRLPPFCKIVSMETRTVDFIVKK